MLMMKKGMTKTTGNGAYIELSWTICLLMKSAGPISGGSHDLNDPL